MAIRYRSVKRPGGRYRKRDGPPQQPTQQRLRELALQRERRVRRCGEPSRDRSQ